MIVTCFMSDNQVENIIVTCQNNIYVCLDANFLYYIQIPDDIFPFFSVSCSTVTVTKCQAALRTLQGFPYFSPTCLCQEPHRDPECNQIREYLFDHPCGIVKTKGKCMGNPFRLIIFAQTCRIFTQFYGVFLRVFTVFIGSDGMNLQLHIHPVILLSASK